MEKPRKKRRVILFAVLFALCACALAWFILSPPAVPDPVYQGRRLSQWLREVNGEPGAPLKPEAAQAVAAMGTNALPYLVREACASDSAIKELLLSVQAKLGGRIFGHTIKDFVERRQTAHIGLEALGALGEKGLVEELTNSDPSVRFAATVALYDLTPYHREATLALINCLSDKEVYVRVQAVAALAIRQRDPEIVIPALMKSLAGGDAAIEESAMTAFKLFGDKSEPAVPMLKQMLTNAAPGLRPAISNALQAIEDSHIINAITK